VAIAPTAYINQGDSLNLNVMIAAYDSTNVNRIRYGIDGDTSNKTNWKETTGGFALDGSKPGLHKVKGEIGVMERGELTWKPWDFEYTVGQPMGVIAQPEMRVLYWGYNNAIESAASGYPTDKIRLSTTGCTLRSNGNGKYVVDVTRGTRTANIKVNGIRDDGSSVSLGSFDFKCKPLPDGKISFGSAQNGGTCRLVEVRSMTGVRMIPDPSVALTNLTYTILDGTVRVVDLPGVGVISANGTFDQRSKNLLAQSAGKTVLIEVRYKDQAGITKVETMTFKVE